MNIQLTRCSGCGAKSTWINSIVHRLGCACVGTKHVVVQSSRAEQDREFVLRLLQLAAIVYEPVYPGRLCDALSMMHPHASCPYCGPNAYSEKCAAGVSDEELIAWFVKHGWRESKSELVERLKREFIITKKEKS